MPPPPPSLLNSLNAQLRPRAETAPRHAASFKNLHLYHATPLGFTHLFKVMWASCDSVTMTHTRG